MLFLDKVKDKYPSLENILEVGAHRGHDIKEILEFWPDANIYAFEADPFNFEICKENCKDFNNVHVLNLAVCDIHNGQLSFNRFCDIENIPDSETFSGQNLQFTGCGSLKKPGDGLKNIYGIREVVEEINVETVTLSKFCEEHGVRSIDAIFMDVQGSEWDVLKGCSVRMSDINTVILEWSTNRILYEDETDFVTIKRFLETNGLREEAREYQLQGINGDSLFLR